MSFEIDPASEFAGLIDNWKAEHQNEHYDPVYFLTRCSKILESALVEFLERNPDPFDKRHPMHVIPECKLGKLLTLLGDCKELRDKMTSSYLQTEECPKNVGRVVIAASRLAVSALKGFNMVESNTDEYINVLISWIINADEPLRTYATSLVGGGDIAKKLGVDKSIHLITTLLKRLWNYIEPDKHEDAEGIAMPVTSGVNNSLETPLSASMCQCYVFHLLTYFGEFKVFLPTFFEWSVLPLINRYLRNDSEDLLVYKALEFLTKLICNHKAATNFIELDGVQKLIAISRSSMRSTGVAFCLHKLAHHSDVMEKICQSATCILEELIQYAIWILDCSHNSGKLHIAGFFSTSFLNLKVLSLFDNLNGMKYLLNMICTTNYIIHAADDGYNYAEDREFPYSTLLIMKSVCVALKKYFEAHIVFKVGQLVKSCPVLKRKYPSFEFVTRCDSAMNTIAYFDVLRELADECSNFDLDGWEPIALFQRLDGVSLLLKIIDDNPGLQHTMQALEVSRVGGVAMSALCAVTLSRSCQRMLTKCYPNLGMVYTGLHVILRYIRNFTSSWDDGTVVEGVAVNYALYLIANCTGGTCAKSADEAKHGTPKYNENYRAGKEALCKLVRHEDGIEVLLYCLEVTKSPETADEMRYLACKALVGLVEYRPVREMLSKLHVFTSRLLLAIQEPVVKEKKELHVKFRRNMELLSTKITGKAIQLAADMNTVQRTDVVSETLVRYRNKDVLLMIHNHLVWSGLDSVAAALTQAAGIVPDVDGNLFVTSKSVKTFETGTPRVDRDGDGANKYRENRALSGTPIGNVSTRRSLRSDATLMHRLQDPYTLSSDGYVKADSKVSEINRSGYPVTLNSLVEEHFQQQHLKCRNHVSTVPHFSLFSPHRCPEPKKKIEESINVHKRLFHQQGVHPKWGGISGVGHHLRRIYSRFRPARVIKSTKGLKPPFTAVAFSPNDDCGVIIGDTDGNLHFSKVSKFVDGIVAGVFNWRITQIEPSYAGDAMLTLELGSYENCKLLAMDGTLDQKLTIDNLDFAEFSKEVQNKIVCTRSDLAMIHDVNTGTIVNNYGREHGEDDESLYRSCFYTENRATFSYDDRLILNAGLLWDVRKPPTLPIHKFDQLSDSGISGVFHPNGLEVIINTAVWDMRNFNLIQIIPALDKCQLSFNRSRSVMYAMKVLHDQRNREVERGAMSAFLTFDSSNYNQLGVVSVEQPVYAIALDAWDRNVAVIETPKHACMSDSQAVCRIYEVGMTRKHGDDSESGSDSAF